MAHNFSATQLTLVRAEFGWLLPVRFGFKGSFHPAHIGVFADFSMEKFRLRVMTGKTI
ncbi:hypothetical protein ABI_03970 [Asticcacaulis biprosthecium C19]|uniref:Uncharacterized protein n=1 Tax=Asticcacaulis biprosthecium C19 TaxID=715226 RepID=F4QJL4_9CAUL|nr:hypothetical protein ABI_03970 [Asticcacaulis biprosthecium C19]